MKRHFPRVLPVVLYLLCVAPAARAATFQVFLDLDGVTTGGCTGPVGGSGFEQRLTTTVDEGTLAVTAVTFANCAAGVYGGETAVSPIAPPWPVGPLGSGTNNSHVIETYLATSDLAIADPTTVRILAAGTENPQAGPFDTVAELVLVLASVVEIPALGGIELIGLAALLLAAGFLVLRRGGAVALVIALVLAGATAAWALVLLDGDPSDWAGTTPVLDAAGDSSPGADIQAFFAREDVCGPTQVPCLAFRFDSTLVTNQSPVANDDTAIVAEDAAVAVQIDVLLNDTDFEGDPFSVLSVSDPANGTAAVTNGGSDVSYLPDPNYCNTPPGSPLDTFTYTLTPGGDTATVSVTVNCSNDAPSITSSATPSVPEGQTSVIDVQSTDPDGETEAAGLTYSLTGGADQALFTIAPATGLLTFNAPPDFESPADSGANNVYDVQVTVTDAGTLTDVQNIAVTVTNLTPEPPAIISPATVSVPENQTAVIDVQSTDPDGDTEGAGLTYSLTGGADVALFSIVPATGVLTFNSAPDFEAPGDAGANNVYDVQVTVTDSGAQSTLQNIQVTVTNVNEAPTITSPATVNAPENQTSVIDVQSTDPEGDTEGSGLSYSLTGGADQALFSIVPATGVLTFNSAPDFETPGDAGGNNVYDVQVTVTDSGALTDVQDIGVTVTDTTEPPAITSSPTPSVPENTTAVIDVQSTDPDGDTEGAGLTYSLTGGADVALFSIVPATGVLTFNSAPNFEAPADAGANNVYDVQVTVTDSGAQTDVQNLQVTVTNVNEAPSITSSATPSVAENQTAVIDVQSTDPDGDTEGAGLSYSITGGADSALFSIVPTTGVLTFNSAPDFENPGDAGANNVYDVQVTVTDSGALTDAQNLQVTVNNSTEPPSITSSATPSVPENTTAVIDVQATDPDGDTEGAGLTYGITGGADAALFSIVPATGALTFNSAPNFEAPGDVGANNIYDVQVTVTDSGAQTDVQNLQVTVTDVAEAPSITSSATVSVPENQTAVIDVQSTDPDGDTEGAGLSYSITGGADAALFSIVPSTGVLTFNSAPNFEAPGDVGADNVYDVQVTVTDSDPLTDVQNLQVTVTDAQEPPSITSSATPSVPENTTAVIDVQSTDPDGDTEGSGLTYSLTGGADVAFFSIVPATGVLTFNSAPNFEVPGDAGANNVYDVQVTVTDSDTDTAVQNLQVTVTNVNEPPVANPDTASITEEAPNVAAANTVAGNVLTNDTDPDSVITVSAVNGNGANVGNPVAGSFGSVTIGSNGAYTYTLDDTNATVNALAPGQQLFDAFNYTASDGALTSSSSLTVTINGADDPPTPDNDAFDFIGNTQLEVDRDTAATPEVIANTPPVPAALGVLDGDTDPDGGTFSISGIVGCGDLTAPFDCTVAGQGTISLQADGSFSFIPVNGDTDPTATFQYTLTGNPTAATVTLTRFERVWYVKNDAGTGGLGRSNDPFDTLGEAEAASLVNDWIFVYFGDGTNTGQSVGILLKGGQHLLGEHVGLSIPVGLNGDASPTNLVTAVAGNRPLIHHTGAGNNGVSMTNAIPVEVRGLNLSSNNANAIDLTSAAALSGSATLTISESVIRTAGAEGIDINFNAGTAGTLGLAFTNNSWTLAGPHAGNAFDVNRAAGTLNLAFSNNTGIVSAATAVNIVGGTATNMFITGFANNTVHQNTGGAGIVISNATFDATPTGAYQQVTGGNTVIGTPGDGVGTAGMSLSGVAGDLVFVDLDVFASGGAAFSLSGTNAAGVGVNVGAGTGTRVTVGTNVAIFQATGGPAVDVSNATVDLQLNSMTSTSSATTGVSLVNVVDGTTVATFSAPTGSSITNATGTDFNVTGGNALVTYNGTITDDVGQLVTVANTTADTKSFTGAITDGNDGDGSGISLTNNTGATIRFSGGLLLSTGGNPAFAATGGGTVEVCDEEPCNAAATGAAVNTITTGAAVALNVANTTIGPNQMEFRSISSNGASSGIVLNNTGTGGLKVKGNTSGNCGGSITLNPVGTAHGVGAPVTADCTGGTIQASTSHGIQLTNTDNVSLTRMHILNSTGDGIAIADVNGFTLVNSYITDGAGAAGDRGIELGDFATGTAVNGTITIANSTIGPTPHDNFGVGIGSGSSSWSMTSNVFTGSVLNSGFNFEIRDATVTSLSITNSVFQSQFADGMQIQPSADANATITQATIQNNTFQNNNIGADLNHDGVSFVTYDVVNNTFLGQIAQPINLFSSAVQAPTTGGTLDATIDGNRIGNSASFKSGSSLGNGIRVNINGGADAAVLINNNSIRQTPNGRGIEIISRNGTGTLDVTVTSNPVNPDFVATVENGGFSLSSIFLQSNCLAVCNTLRSDVRSNTVPAAAPTGELLAGQIALIETGASTAQLVDTTAPISGTCASELAATNTGNTNASAGCSLIAGPIDVP